MKAIVKPVLSITLWLTSLTNLFSQSDYFITYSGDSISNISIKEFPVKIDNFFVNLYNKRLSIRYEDLKIVYTDSKKNKEKKEDYSNIVRYSVNGMLYHTYHSRPIPYSEGKIVFDKIITVPGKNKEELYNLIKSWVINRYSLTAGKMDQVLIEDTQNYKIGINNILGGTQTTKNAKNTVFSNWLRYNLEIRVKDERCRITISDFSYHYETGFIFNDLTKTPHELKAEQIANEWRDEKGTIFSHLYRGWMLIFYYSDEILNSFEKEMLKKDDDW